MHGKEHELLIYDNGFNGDLKKLIGCLKNVKIVGDGFNIGLHSAYNMLLNHSIGDFIFLPHTDMYLMKDWDTALLKESKRHVPEHIYFAVEALNRYVVTQIII